MIESRLTVVICSTFVNYPIRKDKPTLRGRNRKGSQVPVIDAFDVTINNPMQSLRPPDGLPMPTLWEPTPLREWSNSEMYRTVYTARDKKWPKIDEMEKKDPHGLSTSRNKKEIDENVMTDCVRTHCDLREWLNR